MKQAWYEFYLLFQSKSLFNSTEKLASQVDMSTEIKAILQNKVAGI